MPIPNYPSVPTLPGAIPGTVAPPVLAPSAGSDAVAIAQANAYLGTGDVETAARAVGMTSEDVQRLRGAIGATNKRQLVTAIAGFVNLDANQQSAVQALSQGDFRGALRTSLQVGATELDNLGAPPGVTGDLMAAGQSMLSGNLMGAIGPLMAAGLAAGGVGAPIIAAVGGAIALGEAALQALGLLGNHDCAWRVGNTCFNGPRPYGPTDPLTGKANPDWRTLASLPPDSGTDYFGAAASAKARQLSGRPLWAYENVDLHLAGVLDDVLWTEKFLSLGTTTAGAEFSKTQKARSPAARNHQLDGFRLAFGRAYLANVERGINGHPMSGPHEVLDQVAYAWNARHANVAQAAVEIQPAQGKVLDGGLWDTSAIEMILAGSVDGNTEPPLVIYIALPRPAPKVFSIPRAVVNLFDPLAAEREALLHPTSAPVLHAPPPAPAVQLAKQVAPIALGLAGASALIRLLLP